jgi:putative methylase
LETAQDLNAGFPGEEILPRRRSSVRIRLPASTMTHADAAPARPLRRAELIRRLDRIPVPVHPDPEREQVTTPPEAAAELLFDALAAGDLEGRSVLDLGAGTGRLSIGAALLGARTVVGVEIDATSSGVARAAAGNLPVEFRVADVASWTVSAEVVIMNPPFGAQRRHADRPFWDAAFRLGTRGIYAFALSDSREFIARRAGDAGAEIRSSRPVPWQLTRTFRHHTRPTRAIPVDLWEIRTGRDD